MCAPFVRCHLMRACVDLTRAGSRGRAWFDCPQLRLGTQLPLGCGASAHLCGLVDGAHNTTGCCSLWAPVSPGAHAHTLSLSLSALGTVSSETSAEKSSACHHKKRETPFYRPSIPFLSHMYNLIGR